MDEGLDCQSMAKVQPLELQSMNLRIAGLPNYHWALDLQLLLGTDPVFKLTEIA